MPCSHVSAAPCGPQGRSLSWGWRKESQRSAGSGRGHAQSHHQDTALPRPMVTSPESLPGSELRSEKRRDAEKARGPAPGNTWSITTLGSSREQLLTALGTPSVQTQRVEGVVAAVTHSSTAGTRGVTLLRVSSCSCYVALTSVDLVVSHMCLIHSLEVHTLFSRKEMAHIIYIKHRYLILNQQSQNLVIFREKFRKEEEEGNLKREESVLLSLQKIKTKNKQTWNLLN